MANLQKVKVANFSAQLREDRFPDPEGLYSHTLAENIMHTANFTFNGDATTETYQGPPPIAKWRMGLSALSQMHNLYFVASRDMLHVFIPRDLKQKLPSSPDIIIQLPRSKAGVAVGGYIDIWHPHGVNHLKVGFLGDLEILLMACDDGDVIAYYTNPIQYEVGKRDVPTRVRDIQPFFHQNVGASAWGLAIHRHSRIFAVTSNLKEATIFVHGCRDRSQQEASDVDMEVAASQKFPSINSLVPIPQSFGNFYRRRNYRMVLAFDCCEANMPSCDFISGADGEAEEMVLVDIYGTAWLLHIFNRICFPSPVVGMHDNGDGEGFEHMSWGALALFPSDFQRTSTVGDALGVSLREDILHSISCRRIGPYQGHYLNTTPSTNRSLHMAIPDRRNLNPRIEDVEEEHVVKYKIPTPHPKLECPVLDISYINPNTELLWLFLRLPRRIREKISNMDDLRYQYKALNQLSTKAFVPLISEEEKSRYTHDFSHLFIQTFAHDIELVSHNGWRTTLNTRIFDPFHEKDDNEGIFRLNMLALISELNLVVVASQSGNVVLLTLTRIDDPLGVQPPFLSMRQDGTLPLASQKRRFQPRCSLLGMAVSPLQGSKSMTMSDGQIVPRRWRLILHYYDHTILSYELCRGDEDKLVVY